MEQENKLLYDLYTIEFGYIDKDKEKYCLNETNYVDYEEYNKDLLEYIQRAINGKDSDISGYYIECYLDNQELDKEDLEDLENYKCVTDCAMKCNLITELIINYTGDYIDYVYKD